MTWLSEVADAAVILVAIVAGCTYLWNRRRASKGDQQSAMARLHEDLAGRMDRIEKDLAGRMDRIEDDLKGLSERMNNLSEHVFRIEGIVGMAAHHGKGGWRTSSH